MNWLTNIIRWIMSEDGKVTKKILPSVYDRKIILIDLHFVFTQFLSGHGKFNVYLHKIGYRYKSSTLNEITVHQSINPDKLTPIYQTVVKILWLKSLIINIYCGLRSKIGSEIDEDRLVRSSCNHDTSWRKNPIFDDFQIVHYYN
ncbi:hypothetical protein DERF_007411 [Dermatophagoides farinae]|uniref:Uncharacterized protein n=1 Tax=Dermatophagoides farinae TaxID=6954 RepID=A0A922L3L7_DERFA|nr:hypothetical protein DERF_007411 [Dermatophagoides farinae]